MELSIYRPSWRPPPSSTGPGSPKTDSSPAAGDSGRGAGASGSGDRISADNSATRLSGEERDLLQQLRQRERQVRHHEQAHMAASGKYTRGAQFQYRQGPRGQLWAVGGEVGFDSSRPEDPKEAKEKGKTLVDAALAPAQPSNQDLRVASQARQMVAKAQAELRQSQNPAEGDAAYRRSAASSGPDEGRNLDRVV